MDEVKLIFLCDRATLDSDRQKINADGIFSVLTSKENPPALARRFFLVVGLSSDYSESRNFEIRFRRPGLGETETVTSRNIALDENLRRGGRFNYNHILKIENLKLTEEGQYRFEVFVNGTLKGGVDFYYEVERVHARQGDYAQQTAPAS